MASGKAILVLDLGSTSGRAFVFKLPDYSIIGSARFEMAVIENDGLVEMDPDDLFLKIRAALLGAIGDAHIVAEDLLCLGISLQRATFITFDKVTGKPFHRLISWRDNRGDTFVREVNASFLMKIINVGASFLYKIFRSDRMKQGSNFRLQDSFIAPKLKHVIENNRKLQEAMKTGRAMFGTLDTWLLYKLKHVNGLEKFEAITDISSASATGHFDTFDLEYIPMIMQKCKMEKSMMPMIVDSSHDFGYTHKSLLGAPVKIATIIADQAASLIGNGCFRNMDAKITLGTGSFFHVNTGNKCKGSQNGASPMVAWDLSTKRRRSSRVFYTQRAFHDSSTLIKFAKTVGLCSNETELSAMAYSVQDTGGVFFVPNFKSSAGFVGFKNASTKEQLVRAILETVVFKVAGFFFLTKEETSYHFDKIRIDGGISQSDFICQLIADLINIQIERSVSCELTSVGVAYLSSYICSGGFDELEHSAMHYKAERVFHPNETNRRELFMRYKKFEDIAKQYENIKL